MLDRLLRWLTGTAGASASAVFVTNRKPGTILFIGDGRKLAFGESAEVSRDIARQLEAHNE